MARLLMYLFTQNYYYMKKKILLYSTVTVLSFGALIITACGDDAPDGKKYCIKKIVNWISEPGKQPDITYGYVDPSADGSCPYPDVENK
ncbi:hypothetical protein [Lacihabitans lacunae]|uniref:Uncharacterized protein n=1 Tax=Lacihabitans lacunae TaxID=1028214 RepID=A0ABV7Z543_9BACT